jgi:prophage regulatory protein
MQTQITLGTTQSALNYASLSQHSAVQNNIHQLIRLNDVMNITGLKRSSLYAKVAEGRFPEPVKIGVRASAWRLSDVIRWIESPMEYSETVVAS